MRRWLPHLLPGLLGFALLVPIGWTQQPGEEPVDPEAARRPDPAVHVEKGTVWFQAVLVGREGLLEAFLCGPAGRTHETLFVATVDPEALQEAVVGLGLSTASEWARNERELFGLQGSKVLVWVEGPDGTRRMAEDLIRHDFEGRPMRRRGWTLHARRFGETLPEEIEFSLTFKGLRSAALSMFDSPFAYRPFADCPLVGRADVLPELEVEGEIRYPRFRIILEPATEERITRAALEQEGAPPAEEVEPFLEAARRIDALKKEYESVLHLEKIANPGDVLASELFTARRNAAALEIEVAYYELDLLHRDRESRAYEAREDADRQVIGYQRWVLGLLEVQRESARERHRAVEAEIEVLELRRAEAPESEWRRPQLLREACLARVKALELRPQVKQARDQFEAATSDFAREHYGDLLRFLESQVHIADCQALRAELRRELLEPEGERRVELEQQIEGLESEIETAGQIVALYELEQRKSELRRDLNFYRAPGIDDVEKVAQIEREIAEVRERIEQIRSASGAEEPGD